MDSNWMSEAEEEAWRDAFRKEAFHRAAEKDARAENGITGRVDFLLDQISEERRGHRRQRREGR